MWPHEPHAACQASLSITNCQSLPIYIESVMPSNHLILCHPLLLRPSIFPSIRVLFKWVSSSHQVAKVLEFQLHHQSFQWTPRTDSFRMDWLDLLAVQRTLKNLLQHCSSKAPIFWCSAFFIVQLSYPYMYYSLNTLGGKKMTFFFFFCWNSNMCHNLVVVEIIYTGVIIWITNEKDSFTQVIWCNITEEEFNLH